MIIEAIRRTGSPGGVQQLTATVSWRTPSPRRFEVYFRFEKTPGEIADSADPFLIGFLIPAMILGEELEVRGPVDREVLQRIEGDIIPLLRRWFPFLHEIEFRCPEMQAPPPRATEGDGATGFSGGLDAMFAALRYRPRIDRLVTVQGFDIRTFQHVEWQKFLGDTRSAAAALGLPLIEASTNLREVSHYHLIEGFDGRVHPGIYQIGPNGAMGPFLAAVARCMRPFCSSFVISSNEPYEELIPYGSHPLLDPMWSTSSQEILHLGCEYGRIDKLAWLKEHHPEALTKLRVCWRGSPRKANCGRCEKCVRTLAEARACGAEALTTSFAEPLALERVRLIECGEMQRHFWASIADRAAAKGDEELARAAEIVLGRRFYFPRFVRSLRDGRRREHPRAEWRRVRRIMKPPGRASDAAGAGAAEAPADAGFTPASDEPVAAERSRS